MKKLLSKFVHHQPQQKERSPAVTFPQLAPFDSLQEVKQRAIVGWVAHRLATMLDLNSKQNESLFYLSFSPQPLNQVKEEELRKVLQLAESAVDWLQNNMCVGEEIKGLNLPSSYRTFLSRIIGEIQSEDLTENKSRGQDKAWEVYRDVIYAATQGRFLLVDKDELIRYEQGELLCEIEIQERKDIPQARELAEQSFNVAGISPSKIMSYKLIISEAVTNVLKHADGGNMQIYKDGNVVRVVVQDSGSGFPLKLLPQTTLMAGFSTKKSLGQGFTLMMKMAEQIVLETSKNGSTLVLVLEGEAGGGKNGEH